VPPAWPKLRRQRLEMVDQTGDPTAMFPMARRDEIAFHRR
jgi:hypothetical protein